MYKYWHITYVARLKKIFSKYKILVHFTPNLNPKQSVVHYKDKTPNTYRALWCMQFMGGNKNNFIQRRRYISSIRTLNWEVWVEISSFLFVGTLEKTWTFVTKPLLFIYRSIKSYKTDRQSTWRTCWRRHWRYCCCSVVSLKKNNFIACSLSFLWQSVVNEHRWFIMKCVLFAFLYTLTHLPSNLWLGSLYNH